MNKSGTIAEKTGFYIAYIFLFTFAIFFAATFLPSESVADVNTANIEDSIIATKVLSCFSDNKLGVIDDNKMIRSELIGCFAGSNYFLKVDLDKKSGEDKSFSNVPGKLHNSRTVKRYVELEDGEEALLRIEYEKNLEEYKED